MKNTDKEVEASSKLNRDIIESQRIKKKRKQSWHLKHCFKSEKEVSQIEQILAQYGKRFFEVLIWSSLSRAPKVASLSRVPQ